MKKIIWIIVALAVVALGYVAYKKYFSNDDLVSVIPEDAAMVFALDVKSLSEKAGGDKLKELNMYKRMQEELKTHDDVIGKVMSDLINDPLSSGVNFLKRMYVFTTFRNEKPVFGVVGGLLSSSKFEAILKKFPLKDAVVDKDGIKTLKLDIYSVMGWDEKKVVLVGGVRENGDEYVRGLFAENSSVTSLSDFKKFNKSKFDAGVFINYASLMAMTSKYNAAGSMFSDMYKDTYLDMTTNFENNAIVTDVHYYIHSKDAEERLKVLRETGLSADHLKLITNKNLYAIMTASFDMKKFIGMFEQNPLLAGALKEMGQQVGLSMDEIKDLLTGDLSMAFTDVRRDVFTKRKYDFDQKTGAMTSVEVADTMMMPMFTVTLGIKNRPAFEKLITRTGLQKQGPYYVIDVPGVKIYIVENKVGITATNDKLLADEMVQKKELVEISEPAKTLVSNNGSGIYMNLNMKDYPEVMINAIRSNLDAKDFASLENMLSMFKDIEGKYSKTSGTFELKLTEGNGNSLYRIIAGLDKNVYSRIAEREEERKKLMSEGSASAYQDSVVAAAILEAEKNASNSKKQ